MKRRLPLKTGSPISTTARGACGCCFSGDADASSVIAGVYGHGWLAYDADGAYGPFGKERERAK